MVVYGDEVTGFGMDSGDWMIMWTGVNRYLRDLIGQF